MSHSVGRVGHKQRRVRCGLLPVVLWNAFQLALATTSSAEKKDIGVGSAACLKQHALFMLRFVQLGVKVFNISFAHRRGLCFPKLSLLGFIL